MTLDANGDGRIQLGELREWLQWQQARQQPDRPPVAEPPLATPQPPAVLPDVPDYGGANDWYLNSIQAPEAWAEGHTGKGVVVAVVDTGVDLRHSEIRNSLWTNSGEVAGNGRDDDGNGFVDDVHGWDFVNNDRIPQDRNGHGTHVSSLIVGARDNAGVTGVAYDSQLMVLQGLGANGVGDTRDIARAIRYAVDEGADIINLSLSGVSSSVLESAIRYADQHGVFVVIASGNQGAASPSSPAAQSEVLSSVVSVGAFTSSGRLASFSNLAADAVQVVAPGVRLRAATPGGYASYSGTSMAAPLVSGVAALALSAQPDLSSAGLRQLLIDGATQTISGDDSHGAINAAASVAQATAGGRGVLASNAAAHGERTTSEQSFRLASTDLSGTSANFNWSSTSVRRHNGQRKPEMRFWHAPEIPSLPTSPEELDACFASWG